MGAIPTRRVVRIADGHEVTINEADFDPSLHKPVSSVSAGAGAEMSAPGGGEETPFGLNEVNVDDAKEIIAEAEAVDLNKLEAEEKAGRNRVTLLRAIEQRREELGDA